MKGLKESLFSKKAIMKSFLFMAVCALYLFLPMTVSAADLDYQSADTVVVYNANGLYTALADKAVATVYFGNDIDVTRKDIVINPKRDSEDLVIDGNGFTLKEYFVEKSSNSSAIRITKSGTLKNVTVKNAEIIGQNGSGNIYVSESGINLVYDQVNYTGPQMIDNSKGSATIKDSGVNIKAAEGGKASGEVADIKDITFEGTVNIYRADDQKCCKDGLVRIGKKGGSVTVAQDANVLVRNEAKGKHNGSSFVYGSHSYVMSVEENANFDYLGYRVFYYCKSPETFTVADNARVNLDILYDADRSYYKYDAILEADTVTVGENAEFYIYTDGPLKHALVETDNLSVKENSIFHLIAVNNTTKTPHDAILTLDKKKGSVEFDNLKSLIIYNGDSESTRKYAIAFDGSKKSLLKLKTQKVSIWWEPSQSGGPYVLANPDRTWENPGNEPFTIDATFASLLRKGFSALSTTDYYGSDSLTSADFVINNAKIIASEGNRVLKSDAPEINPIVRNSTTVSGKGVPGATIYLTFPGGGTAQVEVDGNGDWILTNWISRLTAGQVVTASQLEPGKTMSEVVMRVVGEGI